MIKQSLVLTTAFIFAALTLSANAATYCPPKGPGAPGYCKNIPHKGKTKPSRPAKKPMLPQDK